MAAKGWHVIRDDAAKPYYSVLGGRQAWTDNQELAYWFADQARAEATAARLGATAHPVGDPEPGNVLHLAHRRGSA